LEFVIEPAQLFIECLFLPESPLEHLNLISQLIVLELVLVSFPPNLLVTLLPQLFELPFFRVFKILNNLLCLIQLNPQIVNQHLLIRLESL
jgi:hypothetical protein